MNPDLPTLTNLPSLLSLPLLAHLNLHLFPTRRPPILFDEFTRKHLRNPSFSQLVSSSPFSRFDRVHGTNLNRENEGEKFDWYASGIRVMPICDLDKRVPHAKRVMGLDIVVWWDINETTWKVFNDSCPDGSTPLSEGRIDQWGRLRCVYHGWCFNGLVIANSSFKYHRMVLG
ncbi:unnamed protein product [Dovyalis caffra]|uniref:Rieske domain-containing protein n=1 Tax=Dovyalis caffra TaxID=77055 RepID=A0AAV1RJ06_9ROSI|nr:unnamed protein product [Dovyalis caffra]